MAEYGTMRVKSGLAEMLKGGVIMDVVNADQAKIAEGAGAVAVMALERVPADIRAQGGVARMSDPEMISAIQEAVTIPVMAKCRIGHFAEAQILEALEIDYIDESEVLTPADVEHHVDKWRFTVPFVCGATNLGEALRRISEGAAMIRTKGEAGTGDIVNAVTHMRAVFGHIRRLTTLAEEELYTEAKKVQAPYELVRWVAEHGRLPVVTFTAGGIATPADAALCMQLGADGVFVGSGIFKSGDPERRAKAIVEATTHFNDAEILARVSAGPRRADGGHLDRDARPVAAARDARLVAAPSGPGYTIPGVAAGKPVWTTSSFLVYSGGLTVLFAAIGALSYLSGQYGAAAYSAWALLIFVLLAAKAEAFRRIDRWLAGGIFAFASVIAWGAFIAALFTWFGWLDSTFSSFCFSRLVLELLVLVAADERDAPLRVPVHRGDRGVRRLVLRHRPPVERRQLDGVGDAVRRAHVLRGRERQRLAVVVLAALSRRGC